MPHSKNLFLDLRTLAVILISVILIVSLLKMLFLKKTKVVCVNLFNPRKFKKLCFHCVYKRDTV
ncbi:hypothetical protein DPMN_082164 [Dreissena polymorpha]|uniref:Uncharacterized protein n=1 Tax=Dreissena polymorpha TaxID=45954 RepID=A0A9D3Y6E3_DREPO|nr:hypothetical protein DPMN_082164 [Dreissena polymorpha]